MSTATSFPLYLLNQLPSPAGSETGELYGSLRKDFRELEKGIKEWLTSKEDTPFSAIAEKRIGQLFTVRIKALKWFAGYKSQIEQLYDFAEQALSRQYDFEQDTLAYLHDNVQFALRTARRIFEGASNQTVGGLELEQAMQDLDPESLSYDKLQIFFTLADIPQTFVQVYLHFLRQGLMLEYAIVAASEIMDHPHQYEDAKITDLSWFIVDAAQEMGASAMQLGIVKRKSGFDQPEFAKLSEEEIKQEQQLAEAGFEDWAKNLE